MQAEYVYDGNNDRLQQVDYTGATPITTMYTNDVFGLTLVADDGSDQVTNLFVNTEFIWALTHFSC